MLGSVKRPVLGGMEQSGVVADVPSLSLLCADKG